MLMIDWMKLINMQEKMFLNYWLPIKMMLKKISKLKRNKLKYIFIVEICRLTWNTILGMQCKDCTINWFCIHVNGLITHKNSKLIWVINCIPFEEYLKTCEINRKVLTLNLYRIYIFKMLLLTFSFNYFNFKFISYCVVRNISNSLGFYNTIT